MQLSGFVDFHHLGGGDSADVYRATRQSTGSTVAIKVFRERAVDAAARDRTERRLAALVGLSGHPNVVHIEEVIESDGTLAVVTEYAPGGSVDDLMRYRGGALSLPEAVLIGELAASALAAAHRRGIVHGAITPRNLLIGSFGQVKVSDFAAANSEHVDDASADVGALAASLHHVLTGSALSPGWAPLDGWTPSTPVAPEALTAFSAVLRDCVSDDRARRPSAAECAERFEEIGRLLGPERRRTLDVVAGPEATVVRGPRTGPAAPPPPVPTVHPPAGGVPGWEGVTVPRQPVVGVPLPPPSSRSASRLPIVLAAVAAVAALVAVAVLLLAGRGGDGETAADTLDDSVTVPAEAITSPTQPAASTIVVTTTTTTTSTTTTTTTTSTTTTTLPPDPEQVAAAQVQEFIASDRDALRAMYGRYLPQLSVKQYDWTEPYTGVYYRWEQILTDHLQFRDRPHRALLAAPFEFSSSPDPWFITFVPAPYDSRDGVSSWCNANGYVYGQTCLARLVDALP